ncbi:plasmid pRiA4b ORF-3 family protein [Patescibacteria group bacterium]|nr:plasmid pRiA4b ORF-3 family protein [Patescibacteria group bacterium]MBU4512380.1 plasmid pRiA4b ORF-3 family protein [Patescibacteria group bacterium]MCG2692489.1 plasmid pRiA4b ORF-3 family protein [Candidatus Parcubacteria bacterium]
MTTYIFKVKLKYDKRTYREIEILENQTLDDLHWAIFRAFDFEEMHLYSFFMNNKAWSGVEFEYCAPQADGRSAKKVKINSLNLELKQKFLYLFDYGDSWEFEMEFVGNGQAQNKVKYPIVVKKAGDSPEQYPDYDEEDE